MQSVAVVLRVAETVNAPLAATYRLVPRWLVESTGLGQNVLDQHVFLVRGGVGPVAGRAPRPQLPNHPDRRSTPSVQQSRRVSNLLSDDPGIPITRQQSLNRSTEPQSPILSCCNEGAAIDSAGRNCRLLQHWTADLPARLAEHANGRGARLLAVVAAHGIGWTLARTWTGTRTVERARKRQGGASRRCPLCGITPRTRVGGAHR